MADLTKEQRRDCLRELRAARKAVRKGGRFRGKRVSFELLNGWGFWQCRDLLGSSLIEWLRHPLRTREHVLHLIGLAIRMEESADA